MEDAKLVVDVFAGYKRLVGLGVTVVAREDWARYTEPVKAPGNYKKEDAIREYIAAAEEKLRTTSATRLLTTQIVEIAVCEELANTNGKFIHFFAKDYKTQKDFSKAVLSELFNPASSVGYLTFDKQLMQSLMLDLVAVSERDAVGGPDVFGEVLPVPYFQMMRGMFDPRMGAEDETCLSRRLNIPEPNTSTPACRAAWTALAIGKKLGYPIYTAG